MTGAELHVDGAGAKGLALALVVVRTESIALPEHLSKRSLKPLRKLQKSTRTSHADLKPNSEPCIEKALSA
jgi:hypothetical protein